LAKGLVFLISPEEDVRLIFDALIAQSASESPYRAFQDYLDSPFLHNLSSFMMS
jgi:hypothetical protein